MRPLAWVSSSLALFRRSGLDFDGRGNVRRGGSGVEAASEGSSPPRV